MRESKTLEFKESITNTFLKTVSAYANYGEGVVVFGINDDGAVVGISNLDAACLAIENKINDSISPNPEYTLEPNERAHTITLTVKEGLHKPYLYKSKAYRRNDTATIAVDRVEFGRLVLEGQNLSYDQAPAQHQSLSFSYLEKKLRSALGVTRISSDVLKTLELQNGVGVFDNAGELLADENGFPGIDIVRFGASISILENRKVFEKRSVLEQYDQALDFYRTYYQFEEIVGAQRVSRESVPSEAFREAVANALVHRQWDIPAQIRVSMFNDRIEVVSPGGLPHGLTQAEYEDGQVSLLRNPVLGNVFFRLGIIERFGTGVLRIKDVYRESEAKPQFKAYDNSVTVVLPVIKRKNGLTDSENTVYQALKGKVLSMSQIAAETGFGRSKALALTKQLVSKGVVTISGRGRGTKYQA